MSLDYNCLFNYTIENGSILLPARQDLLPLAATSLSAFHHRYASLHGIRLIRNESLR